MLSEALPPLRPDTAHPCLPPLERQAVSHPADTSVVQDLHDHLQPGEAKAAAVHQAGTVAGDLPAAREETRPEPRPGAEHPSPPLHPNPQPKETQ